MNALIVLTLALIAGASAQYNYNWNYEIPVPQGYGQDQYNQQYNQQYNGNQQYQPVKAIPDARCPRTDDPTRPVHLPFSGNCGKFMKCTGGMGFVMDCPAGLEFSTRMSRCDYPALAQCSNF